MRGWCYGITFDCPRRIEHLQKFGNKLWVENKWVSSTDWKLRTWVLGQVLRATWFCNVQD